MDMAQLGFDVSSVTHAGKVRERNEDSCLVRTDTGLWAVADGMGGHEAGDLASRILVESLDAIGQPEAALDLLEQCEAQIFHANQQIMDLSRARNGAIIGTTAAVLLVRDRHYACVWAGDSRIYLISGGGIKQLSRDHTEVEELVAGPRSQGGHVVEDRLEQVGGGLVVLVEEQRLTEPDDQVEPVARGQLGRVDVAQRRPRGGELGGVGGGPELLQPSPADDQAGWRPDRVQDALGRLDGLFKPARVVVGTGRRQGVGRRRSRWLGGRRDRQHEHREDRGGEPPESRIRHSLL